MFAEALSEDDLKHLKTMEGVWHAYEGVRALGSKLKVLQISGSAVVLSSQIKSEFQQAPHFVRERFESVEKDHLELWRAFEVQVDARSRLNGKCSSC